MTGAPPDATPVGILTITINEAKGLKNQEVIGVSDPYASIVIGGVSVAKTRVVDNTYVYPRARRSNRAQTEPSVERDAPYYHLQEPDDCA